MSLDCVVCGKPIHDSVAGLLYALNIESEPPRFDVVRNKWTHF